MNGLPISRRKPHTHTRRHDHRPGGVLTQIHVEYLRSAEPVEVLAGVGHDERVGIGGAGCWIDLGPLEVVEDGRAACPPRARRRSGRHPRRRRDPTTRGWAPPSRDRYPRAPPEPLSPSCQRLVPSDAGAWPGASVAHYKRAASIDGALRTVQHRLNQMFWEAPEILGSAAPPRCSPTSGARLSKAWSDQAGCAEARSGRRSSRRGCWALIATTIVEMLMRMAPTAGAKTIPTVARTPAASGMGLQVRAARGRLVAAAHRNDARIALSRVEGEELVRHAARLEGARPLEQLELERRRDAEQPRHPGAGDRRCPFHVIRDRTGRRANLLDGHLVAHGPHAIRRGVPARDAPRCG